MKDNDELKEKSHTSKLIILAKHCPILSKQLRNILGINTIQAI
jgi:hypothetical protein